MTTGTFEGGNQQGLSALSANQEEPDHRNRHAVIVSAHQPRIDGSRDIIPLKRPLRATRPKSARAEAVHRLVS